jgi:hypothetical protein
MRLQRIRSDLSVLTGFSEILLSACDKEEFHHHRIEGESAVEIRMTSFPAGAILPHLEVVHCERTLFYLVDRKVLHDPRDYG